MAGTHLIPRVAGSTGTGIVPSGPAPDVLYFHAGTLQDSQPGDTTAIFTGVMHWDPLNRAMTFDWGCVRPSDATNFSQVEINIKRPHPSGSGFEWVSTGQVVKSEEFTPNAGVFTAYGRVGIELSQVPSALQTWTIIACSYNAATEPQPNLDSGGKPTGPSVTLQTLSPVTPVDFAPPVQPADNEWTLTVAEYPHDEQTGQNFARLQIVCSRNTSDTTFFSAFTYEGTSPPSDPSAYQESTNETQATAGSTTLNWQVPLSETSTKTIQVVLVASSTSFFATGKQGGTPKSVVLQPASAPNQVANFTVTVEKATNGGVVSGRLTYHFDVPNDPRLAFVHVFRQQTDSNHVALGSAAGQWAEVASIGVLPAQIGTTMAVPQRDWWVWIDGASDWKFKAQSISRAPFENAINPPTFDLHMDANAGLDLRKIDSGSFNNAEFQVDPNTGQWSMKGLDFTKGFSYDTGLFKIVNGRWGLNYDNNSFTIDGTTGALKLGNVNYTSTLNVSTDFQVVNGQLQIKNVDFSKAYNLDVGGGTSLPAKITVHNHSGAAIGWIGDDTGSGYDGAWFKRMLIGGTSPGTAQIYADASGNAVFTGLLGAATVAAIVVSAAQIQSGTLLVGGGSGKPGKLTVFNHSGIATGWIGDDVSGSGYDGAWFKRIMIGGTSPANAQMVTDSLGNAVFNGSLGVGVTITTSQVIAGTFNGFSLVLNKNNITTTIDAIYVSGVSGYAGVLVKDNSSNLSTVHDPVGFRCLSASGTGLAQMLQPGGTSGRLVLNDTTGNQSVFAPTQIQLSNSVIVNTSNQFVGAGVNCPTYGVAAAGFNPYVSGQYFGGSDDIRAGVTINGTFGWVGFTNNNGASFATYMRMRGGAYIQLI